MRPPTALVLAAGLATRLGPLRERWAKACVPVGGTTPLRFLLERLHAAGVRRSWVNLHHHAAQVRAEAQDAAPEGLELAFLEEPVLLGTGGTLLAVAERDGRLPELVANAKVFTDLDFAAALRLPAPSVLLHAESDLGVFGGLRHDADGFLTGLRRAGPPAREPGVGVFTGVSRPAPAWLPPLRAAASARPGQPVCLVRDGLLPALEAGQPVLGRLHAGWWLEVSTPERVAEAERRLREQEPACAPRG